MPFDTSGSAWQPVGVVTDTLLLRLKKRLGLVREPVVVPDLSKPSLQALSYMLRHPETWPEGLVWDFRYEGTPGYCKVGCALGIAVHTWGDKAHGQKLWGMPTSLGLRIFYGADDAYDCDMRHVTPEMVADKIDEYLASGRLWPWS